MGKFLSADDLPAGIGRYFCHRRYFVPRKRFRWYKSDLSVRFVPLKRFIPYGIAAHSLREVD